MNIKKFAVLLTFMFVFFLSTGSAMAHVTVKPGEVGVGQRLNFTVSVPTEEETPTVSLRLIIPEGVTSVRPNAKPGWNIQLKKEGEGEEARISEIVWSGGRIPAEQRDEFVFSAQAPAEGTTLVWKAYQTYGDGDVVSWDNDPKVVEEYTKNNPPKEEMEGMEGMGDDHTAPRPYSTTKVVNDLGVAASGSDVAATKTGGNAISWLALAVAALSLGLQLTKKK